MCVNYVITLLQDASEEDEGENSDEEEDTEEGEDSDEENEMCYPGMDGKEEVEYTPLNFQLKP